MAKTGMIDGGRPAVTPRTGDRCCVCRGAVREVFRHGAYRILECPSCYHRMTDIPEIDVAGLYTDDYFFGGAGETRCDYMKGLPIFKCPGRSDVRACPEREES
jgi:hypothetical protein